MKKYLLAGIFALFASTQANASWISPVNGSDMAGITVTVTFVDLAGSLFDSPAIEWVSTGSDSGAATGLNWSLAQAGDTFASGPNNAVSLAAAWMFTNNTQLEVFSITINAWAAGFVFDLLDGDASGNGSGPGRTDVPFSLNVLSSFPFFSGENAIVPGELYGSLLLGFETPTTESFQFIADTDAQAVPAPAIIGMLVAALGFAGFARRK